MSQQVVSAQSNLETTGGLHCVKAFARAGSLQNLACASIPIWSGLLPRLHCTDEFGDILKRFSRTHQRELLDRPMRGREIEEKLQITHQRVRELLITLHALGCVNFGDLPDPSWIAMRAGDKTCLLSRDEERVLSAIPREYATDATKIRLAAQQRCQLC